MSAMVPQTSTPLESVPGLGDGLVEKLGAAGVTTVEALADMTPEQLEAIEGIGPKTVEKISLAVNNYFASLEGGADSSSTAIPSAPESLEAGAEGIAVEEESVPGESPTAEESLAAAETAPEETEAQGHSAGQIAEEENSTSEKTEQ
jgi:N utilization substance protein A